MPLNLREVEVFRPYSNEIPEDLLWAEGLQETEVARWLAADMVRIAKRQDEVLGIYAMDRDLASDNGATFVLHGLVVAPAWRKQGVGRWLVGHAIGVAESKGGRRVRFPSQRAQRFLSSLGFVEDGQGQRFDLIPE